MYSEFVFFRSYGDHRDLHSFPTRRSSDLSPLPFAEPDRLVAVHGTSVDAQRRSEEHTSELQSLAYLVCRLLLEKKNSTAIHTEIVVELIRAVADEQLHDPPVSELSHSLVE